MQTAFRLFERGENGSFRTLVHGIPVEGSRRRSRTIIPGKWYDAEVMEVTNPGSGNGTKYQSGFHICASYEDAYNYLHSGRFRARKDKIAICAVLVDGNVWVKPTNSTVMLAERMFLAGEAFTFG